jgi:hypothetical protein
MLLWSSIDWRFNVVDSMLISGRVIQQRKLLTSSLKLALYLILWPFWSIRLLLNVRPSLHIIGYIYFSFSAINLNWNTKNQHWTHLYRKGNLVIRIKSVKWCYKQDGGSIVFQPSLALLIIISIYFTICVYVCVCVWHKMRIFRVYTYIYVWVQR